MTMTNDDTPQTLGSDEVKFRRPVNWNKIEDETDKAVWDRVNANFWLPEKVPLSNDLPSWATLTDAEKKATNHVFAGLTLLDTIQSEVGVDSLRPDSRTLHEEAVLAQFAFMECLTGEHSLYTSHGWVPVAEVAAGDEVAQYDAETGLVIWGEVQQTSTKTAQTYRISEDGVTYQHVSAGHRVLLEYPDVTEGITTWLPVVYTAEHLYQHPEKLGGKRLVLAGTSTDDEALLDLTRRFDERETGKVAVSVAGQEQVYGVEVPTTFLVTRYGEDEDAVVSMTGNCVHAKSYSSVFATLVSSRESEEALRWAETNEHMRNKQKIVLNYYEVKNDPEKRKIASTMLESFLFYSGFFLPFWWSSIGKLTNTADLIRLIVRDELVHGYYIGYKFQLAYREASQERQKELRDFAHALFKELYANEIEYTKSVYDEIGLTDEVLPFLRYNANKAFQNLGFEAVFEESETEILPQILSGINTADGETHDFFSGAGSSYVTGDSKMDEVSWDDLDLDDDDD